MSALVPEELSSSSSSPPPHSPPPSPTSLCSGQVMRVEVVDDGHSPGGSHEATKLVYNLAKNSSKFLAVYDDLVSPKWCQRAYAYALKKKRPWGVYVLRQEAEDRTLLTETLYESGEIERAIAIEYVRCLLYQKAAAHIAKDFSRIHGTVVWCLQSGTSASVTYHIDYAELYRYETDTIHPPLYAGTAHISPKSILMKGGDFMANTEGLDHYRRFGYKGRLATEDALKQDIAGNGDWIRVWCAIQLSNA